MSAKHSIIQVPSITAAGSYDVSPLSFVWEKNRRISGLSAQAALGLGAQQVTTAFDRERSERGFADLPALPFQRAGVKANYSDLPVVERHSGFVRVI